VIFVAGSSYDMVQSVTL